MWCRSPTSTSAQRVAAGLALVCLVCGCSHDAASGPVVRPQSTRQTLRSADADAVAPRQRLSLFSRGGVDAGAAPVDAGWRPPGTGVALCDDYLRKYYRCYKGRLQGIQAKMLRTSLDTMSMAWRRTARTASGRASLLLSCRNLLRKARAGAQVGCRW
jgi:hypothetical protein